MRLPPFSNFYGKIWVGFCLNTGKRFVLEVSFYSQQKEHRFFQKTVLGIIKLALCLRDVFMWQSVENFERFQYFNFETNFLRNENLFQKLEYCFLVESTKNEYNISKQNYPVRSHVKTNKISSTKWTYHKERGFASNYFIFSKNFQHKNFSIRTSYKELIWWTNYPNIRIHTFCKCWSFTWRCFFPVSILR